MGRRYTAARLLHVRMVSSRAAVAVVLCRAKSEADGQETRVVVTTTLVDGVLFDQTLQQPSATPADGAEQGSERRSEWKIVHEDVSVGGLLANVPVLAMPPLGGGAVEGESQIATAWPAELSDWYLGTKAAAADYAWLCMCVCADRRWPERCGRSRLCRRPRRGLLASGRGPRQQRII